MRLETPGTLPEDQTEYNKLLQACREHLDQVLPERRPGKAIRELAQEQAENTLESKKT